MTALTTSAAEVVRAQFTTDGSPVPTREPARRLDGARAALAAVLERAARAVAPPRARAAEAPSVARVTLKTVAERVG